LDIANEVTNSKTALRECEEIIFLKIKKSKGKIKKLNPSHSGEG
jgi:hypothetical protein